MSAMRLSPLLLALTLGACAGDPDLPRSYPQPGLFGTGYHESRQDEGVPSAPYGASDGPAQVYYQPQPQAQIYAPQPQEAYPRQYAPQYAPESAPQANQSYGQQTQAQTTYPRQYAPQYAPQSAPQAAQSYGPQSQTQSTYPRQYAPQYAPQTSPQAAQSYRPQSQSETGYSQSPAPYPAGPYAPQTGPIYAPPSAGQTRWGGTYADWTQDDYRYRLGPGDELALRFLINSDLNSQVIVGPDGRGVFPLVSGVKVADLTVEQANQVLTEAYAQVLRAPQVEVLVNSYGAAQVFVGGEVKEPGVKSVKGQLTPAQAVMSAGGALSTARTGRVVVIRQRPGGRILMKTVDLKAYLAGGGATGDGFAVLPGDLVFVPRSKISEVDLFVEQYIKGVLPFTPSFGYSINRGRTY